MADVIKKLNTITKIQIEGYDKGLELNLADKRVINKLIHAQVHYAKGDKFMEEVYEKAKSIEDPLERLAYISDMELKFLTELKDIVNDIFGTDIVTPLFGDGVPSVEMYFVIFEALAPYIREAVKKQKEISQAITEKYGLDRLVKPDAEDTEKFGLQYS